MQSTHRGTGAPLLLVHGLGSSARSWSPIMDKLAAHRHVIAVDLPGFGTTPPLAGEVSIRTLADALTDYLRVEGLLGIDAVGSSMGARLVLELARRGGVLGGVISLDPGGFWQGWQRRAFFGSVALSIRLVRLLKPMMPFLTRHACFPSQAKRALELFPNAKLHWFAHSGHFPHWDAPKETVQLILEHLPAIAIKPFSTKTPTASLECRPSSVG